MDRPTPVSGKLMNRLRSGKDLWAYGAALAILLILLKWAEYRFVLATHAYEMYAGILALIFTGLGIWLAQRLSNPRVRTVVVEKEIRAALRDDFAPNTEEIRNSGLSRRELEVLEEMAKGSSNQEIAENLHVSLNTVKTHVARILEKLEADRRTQAIELARKKGIIA